MLSEPAVIRIDIGGTAAAPELLRVSLVTLAEDTPVLPSLGGDLMLVSRVGGRVHQAMPFRMPTEATIESRDETGMHGVSVPLESGQLSLFLDATEPLDSVEVLDESGGVLLSAGSAELRPQALRSHSGLRKLAEPTRSEALADLAERYPHIAFLDPVAGDVLPLVYALGGSEPEALVPISDTVAATLGKALARVPKPALAALRSVALAKFEAGSNDIGVSFGSSLVINQLIETEPLQVVETVVHEATHNYQYLLDNDVSTALWNPDAWPDDVRAQAAASMARFSLAAGVTNAWHALHESGVGLGLAGDYTGSSWMDLSDPDAAPAGFASAYGSEAADEDMAEYVAHLSVPDNGGASPVCDLLRAAPSPFPAELAIPLAKVKFLEGLDLLDADQVRSCMGTPDVTGPEGIHLGGALSVTSDLKAGWLDADGGHFLAVTGYDQPVRLLLRVKAPNDQALGLHRLDSVGLFNLDAANNAMYLAHDTEPLRARTSAAGLVLVTAVNTEKVEGVVFFLSLQSAAGFITDVFPLSTFLVSGQ